MGWSPGEGDHAWLRRVLALACLHAPSFAHSHHAMTKHESCHQVHRLHLGLTQCPEPKGTTPLSYINHTVYSISGQQQKTDQHTGKLTFTDQKT